MKKQIMFLCTGNSCRSQMAEGLLRHYKGDQYDVYSAGTNPVGINPYAIKIMAEIGIDLSGQRSESIDIYKNKEFDIVITVCNNAKESCPVLSVNSEKLHWPFPDPAEATGKEEQVLTVFRQVRNQIKDRIIKEL